MAGLRSPAFLEPDRPTFAATGECGAMARLACRASRPPGARSTISTKRATSSISCGLSAAARAADPLAREAIVDQVGTMFSAGFTTTALALFWTVLMLALFPMHQEALRGELCSDHSAAPPTWQSLRSSRTATAFLFETLRLYPPAYIIAREARLDDRIGDLRIREALLSSSPRGLCIGTRHIGRTRIVSIPIASSRAGG